MVSGNGSVRRSVLAAATAFGALLAVTALAPQVGAVIGGTDADEPYPFMATLRDDRGAHFCGGTLVDPEWVLTAGHCVDAEVVAPGDLTVALGDTDRTAGVGHGVREIVTHPDYVADLVPHPTLDVEMLDLREDIALIRLDEPVDAQPLELAPAPRPGDPVRALGWGMTCEDGAECPAPPIVLQQLDTEIVPDGRCTGLEAGRDHCSEHPTEPAQVCTLDSGGPMLQWTDGRWALAGVISRDGDYVTDPNCVGPQVMTGAAAHAEWIGSTVAGGSSGT